MAYIQSSCSWTFTSSLLAAMPLTTLSSIFTLKEPAMRHSRFEILIPDLARNALTNRVMVQASTTATLAASIFGSAARVGVKPVQAVTIHTIHSYVKVGCRVLELHSAMLFDCTSVGMTRTSKQHLKIEILIKRNCLVSPLICLRRRSTIFRYPGNLGDLNNCTCHTISYTVSDDYRPVDVQYVSFINAMEREISRLPLLPLMYDCQENHTPNHTR